jgi:hypothetical protein
MAPAVFAEDGFAKYEVFAGFSAQQIREPYMVNTDGDNWIGSKGVEASFAKNLNPALGVKADVGLAFGNAKDWGHSRRYTFLAGPQFTKRGGSVDFFGHALAGFARIDDDLPGARGRTANGFAMAFGGGIDWRFSPNVGWRVFQFDYLPIHASERFRHDMRWSTGVLIPLGE